MQNLRTLGHPILGEKYVTRKEETKNNPKNSGHYVPLQGQRTHFASTKTYFLVGSGLLAGSFCLGRSLRHADTVAGTPIAKEFEILCIFSIDC